MEKVHQHCTNEARQKHIIVCPWQKKVLLLSVDFEVDRQPIIASKLAGSKAVKA